MTSEAATGCTKQEDAVSALSGAAQRGLTIEHAVDFFLSSPPASSGDESSAAAGSTSAAAIELSKGSDSTADGNEDDVVCIENAPDVSRASIRKGLLQLLASLKDGDAVSMHELRPKLETLLGGVGLREEKKTIKEEVERILHERAAAQQKVKASSGGSSKKRKIDASSGSSCCSGSSSGSGSANATGGDGAVPADLESGIPEEFLCPISLEIMADPVVAADGFSYEREAIEEWLEKHTTSPKTNQELAHHHLTPNTTLLVMIQDRTASIGAL